MHAEAELCLDLNCLEDEVRSPWQQMATALLGEAGAMADSSREVWLREEPSSSLGSSKPKPSNREMGKKRYEIVDIILTSKPHQ
jgi:hypothetical protein